MSTRTVKLSVFNDLICAFCYIGHHELLDAVAQARELQLPLNFDIEYIPYRLMGSACWTDDIKDIDIQTFLQRRLGEKQFAQNEALAMKWAQEKNVAITYKIALIDSFQAHRLSRKAYVVGGQRMQLPILDAMFKAYLVDAKGISDDSLLADIAEEVGLMTRDDALEFLASDELRDEVTKLQDDARDQGVKGVPLTVINGKWAVSGVQPASVYLQIFKKLAAGVPKPVSPPPFPALIETGICA